jgi:hypothetical protein
MTTFQMGPEAQALMSGPTEKQKADAKTSTIGDALMGAISAERVEAIFRAFLNRPGAPRRDKSSHFDF